MPDENTHDYVEDSLVGENESESTEPQSTESEREVPKLFKHCLSLYELLNAKAIGTEGDKIYSGSISPLVVSLGLAPSYQSKLVSRLKEMGCISMLKRGSGAAKSVWGLYKIPTLDDFYGSDNTGDIKWRKEKEKYDEHTQRIKDLTKRITALEDFARQQGMNI